MGAKFGKIVDVILEKESKVVKAIEKSIDDEEMPLHYKIIVFIVICRITFDIMRYFQENGFSLTPNHLKIPQVQYTTEGAYPDQAQPGKYASPAGQYAPGSPAPGPARHYSGYGSPAPGADGQYSGYGFEGFDIFPNCGAFEYEQYAQQQQASGQYEEQPSTPSPKKERRRRRG